ncbi:MULTISPECIES: anthranilate synthase component II [Alteromonadaceae]|uniref:anthranilate synthase component II n=1 Tax=Alteromonadaceae TaxID=72275 RepID=UPI001C08720F|nr:MULTISPECIES: aminodeoxychorismate/anthranilate synthase component II [Aliiglaciecola]MBU2878540.1 aminodeoxychorismate/anthranilate synthase component II [Aliiglaciecola lipolytica]MDO6709632.1 aminodeoxychorismate/anthranilate synthase component II [Aliiglaciecola sp. 2_MG-2023]MDO6750826.1 aminodeoxychorismate/anthranilate synthase component II [Aliiglaciecola sp. 1_MG-2023]
MLLLIDNYDSFTHNLARYFRELNVEVQVVRNDQITCEQIAQLAPQYLVFSPGPCTPNEAGVTLEAIRTFAGKIPILGVCLGHQAIGQIFGAKVEVAEHIMHGKTSSIRHNSTPLFENIEDPFIATRYHSLILNCDSLPKEFDITAWCEEFSQFEPMAIEHKIWPLMGMQFHPESLLTKVGHKLLSNFVKIADRWWLATNETI